MSGHVFSEEANGLRFVGDFAGLYAGQADPWDQSASSGAMADYYAFSRIRLVESLKRHTSGPCLEIGCGHGHLTALLHRHVGPSTGMDIAPEAVNWARKWHQGPQFITGDIAAEEFLAPGVYPAVILAQCWWYLLHQIDRAVENTLACVERNGIVAVSQAFLRGEQRYGTEVADGFEGTLRLFMDRYADKLRLIEARYDDSGAYCHNDGLLIFRAI